MLRASGMARRFCTRGLLMCARPLKPQVSRLAVRAFGRHANIEDAADENATDEMTTWHDGEHEQVENDDIYEPDMVELENYIKNSGTGTLDWDEDRREVEVKLKTMQANLGEMDKFLTDEWIKNDKNGVYYNPSTEEVKVPFEKSYAEYKARRADRQRARFVADQNNSIPDFLSPLDMNSTASLYTEEEMRMIRKKYNHLDFKELGKVLAEADTRFFENTAMPNIMKFGPVNTSKSLSAAQQDWDEENLKFLKLLPFKYHLATFRRV